MTTYPLTCSNTLSRRLMLGLLAAQFAMPMLIGTAKAASLDEIKKRGLIVATEDDFRPFEFVKDGKPTGFDNELIEDLRKYAPFEIKQEILPWTGILAGVSTGKYDVAITAAIITKERKKSLDFTSPIADATHYYVKRKDDKSISSIKDLTGKTVGVQAGIIEQRFHETNRFGIYTTDLILRSRALGAASRRMAACTVVVCGHPS